MIAVEGDCRTPIGAFAERTPQGLHLRAFIAKPDGSAHRETERTIPWPVHEADAPPWGKTLVAIYLPKLRSRLFSGPVIPLATSSALFFSRCSSWRRPRGVGQAETRSLVRGASHDPLELEVPGHADAFYYSPPRAAFSRS